MSAGGFFAICLFHFVRAENARLLITSNLVDSAATDSLSGEPVRCAFSHWIIY